MDIFENIKGHYILSNVDPNFAAGRRANLRYACEYLYASLMELNPKGVDPFEYLNFAKSDISTNELRAALNGLGNAKRAIHLTIDCFFEMLGLANAFRKSKFPTKLDIIQHLEAFPTTVIKNLNKRRNFVEHDYTTVEINEVIEFVDITEMFLRLCYPFLKHMVIGIHVGLKNDERDIVWILDLKNSQINIYENLDSKSFNSPIGVIFYNFSDDETNKKHIKSISIEKSNMDEWLSYLNAFVYCTKRAIIPVYPPYNPEEHERLMIFRSTLIF